MVYESPLLSQYDQGQLDSNAFLEFPSEFATGSEQTGILYIERGAKSHFLIERIMHYCPNLRSHKESWKLLIERGVDPETFELADTSIKKDNELMTRAIEKSGPKAFTFALQPTKTMALLALKLMVQSNRQRDHSFDLYSFCDQLSSMIEHIFAVQGTRDDPETWRCVIQLCSESQDFIFHHIRLDRFWRRASLRIRDNEDIMRDACLRSSAKCLQFASYRLRTSTELLRDIMQHSCHKHDDYLLFVPNLVFNEDPDLVVHYLRNDGDAEFLFHILPEDLWSNREIVLSYLKHGGSPHDYIDESARTDWDLCLAHVEGNTKMNRLPFSSWISTELLQSKKFLLEATKLNKWVLRYATLEVQKEPFEMLLMTSSYHGIHPLRTFQMLSRRPRGTQDNGYVNFDIVAFAKDVLEMLETNKSFWLFLTGLTIEREGCLLSMLNIGSGITEAIASFAGVPRGEQLTQMQQIKQLCIEIRDDPQVGDKYISGNRDITMYSGMMVLQHTTPPYM